jgi:membrane fusion protein
VADISRSALSPADVGALVGEQAREPLYRVQITLDRQTVPAYGKAELLKPGMALEADILMERRRLIEWAFEPLYGIGHRLSGEARHG